MDRNILPFNKNCKSETDNTARLHKENVDFNKTLQSDRISGGGLRREHSLQEVSAFDADFCLDSGASAEIIDFAAATADQAEGIRRARLELAISLVEAADVLGISASTLEREEAKPNTSLNYNDVVRKYEFYVASVDGRRERRGNLIFGSLPLKVARHILDLSIEQMAHRQGYSLGHWKKIETNFRPISDEKVKSIEKEVKAEFENLCSR